MKILIATGIYPPQIGGPAQYAKNLEEEFQKMGHSVSVKTYNLEYKLPTGIRHLYFFLKIIPKVIGSDIIFALDTFSVGFPAAVAGRIFGRKVIIRTGGDFLWEGYVERTGKKVLLKNFYDTEISNFSDKEKIIFRFTKWTLNNVSSVIFSTSWQRKIFLEPYNLLLSRTRIVENYYGPKESNYESDSKIFIASTRNLVWKNLSLLEEIFDEINNDSPEVKLFKNNMPFKQFMDKIAHSYAVVLISLGDISPNMILDAIRYNRPFICTKETGIYDRIKDAGIFVDPSNKEEIKRSILDLLTEKGHKEAKERVKKFNFTHSWEQIAEEFLEIYKTL